MNIRVRFAPAPTGNLHVGSVRTALFNWLFAEKTGGEFRLRVDDTDHERSRREYEEEILAGLSWLGLSWNPSVWRQSERGEEYLSAVASIPLDFRYEDFSTEEETLAERQRGMDAHRVPNCPWRDRVLSPAEREGLIAEGRRPAVRFRVPRGETITVNDLIRGEINFSTDEIEDFVLLRGDGSPSYQLTTVVDDHAQGITHIVRGEDHVANIPKQLLLMRALGYPPPVYAHLPLVLGPDGQKLSKRHGGTRVMELKEKGLLPEAVINHLALVGWSSADGNEIFTPAELVAAFDLSRVNKAAASYDETKLIFLNRTHLHHLPAETIVRHLAEIGITAESTGVKPDLWTEAVDVCRASVSNLIELGELIAALFASELSYEAEVESVLRTEAAQTVLKASVPHLKEGLIDPRLLSKEVGKSLGVKGKAFFEPIRSAWTGRVSGPELARLSPLLGAECLLKRTEAAIRLFGKGENPS